MMQRTVSFQKSIVGAPVRHQARRSLRSRQVASVRAYLDEPARVKDPNLSEETKRQVQQAKEESEGRVRGGYQAEADEYMPQLRAQKDKLYEGAQTTMDKIKIANENRASFEGAQNYTRAIGDQTKENPKSIIDEKQSKADDARPRAGAYADPKEAAKKGVEGAKRAVSDVADDTKSFVKAAGDNIKDPVSKNRDS